jgi:exopolysaccharide biosynthesis predicted pyruvyltransferase EpsI
MPTTDVSRLLLHPTSIPDAQLPVPTLLRQMNPRTAYLIEMPGNHGDKLSYLGMNFLLGEMRIKRTFNLHKADVILLLGQATMTDMWGWGLATLRMVFERCPDTPVVVLPASYYFTETDFPAMFRNRKQRVVLLARDTESWARLSSLEFPDIVERYCDHDLAYYLRDTPFMARLRREAETAKEDSVLVVERWDAENPLREPSEKKRKMPNPEVPSAWKLFLKSRFWQQKQALYRLTHAAPTIPEVSPEYRAECDSIIEHYEPWAKGLPWRLGDVSDTRMHSIETFGKVIARSKLVLSTRMHVGIVAGMLGIPTYMRTGAFGKLSGGYAMSMYDWPHVKLFGPGGKVEDRV